MSFKIFVAAAITLLSGPAFADSNYEGTGATASLDCKGGAARIEGARNSITVTGQCAKLEIEGEGNAVTVELASGGLIQVVGASNAVFWTTPDGREPKVQAEGFANMVQQAQ